MFNQFKSYIQPFKERLENILKYGKSTLISGSEGELQKVQIKTLRDIEDSLKMGQFGFNSKMPNGSRIVAAEISTEKIILANEHLPSILDISQGNVIIYNQNGNFIKLDGDTITTDFPNVIANCETYTINATTSFTVNSPDSNFNGGTVKNDGVSMDNTHIHSQPNDSANNSQANTNAPIN